MSAETAVPAFTPETIADAAAAAWAHRRAAEERRDAERRREAEARAAEYRERARADLRDRAARLLGLDTEPTDAGIALPSGALIVPRGKASLALAVPCPRCGKPYEFSGAIVDLAGLGAMLAVAAETDIASYCGCHLAGPDNAPGDDDAPAPDDRPLAERAAAAWEERLRAAREGADDRLRYEILARLNAAPERIEGGDEPVAVCGRLAFRQSPDGYALQLRGRCPGCGAETWSRNVHNVIDLGRQLAAFEADPEAHRCPSVPPPADPLGDAIRALIRAELDARDA